MNSWSGFDFLIFLIFAANTVLGMSRGANKEIISTICLSVALIITIKFTVPLTHFFTNSPLIHDVIDSSIIQNFMMAIGAGPMTEDLLTQLSFSISLLICFVGAFSICEGALVATGMVESYSFPYAAFNRKVGAALGCTRGYVISLIVILILTLHLFKDNNTFFADSFFVNLFRSSTVKLDSIIAGQHPEDYTKVYEDKNLYNSTDVLKSTKQQVSPSGVAQ